MKVKLEIKIFSFNWYVFYVTRGFVASTRDFNLLTRAFNPPTLMSFKECQSILRTSDYQRKLSLMLSYVDHDIQTIKEESES